MKQRSISSFFSSTGKKKETDPDAAAAEKTVEKSKEDVVASPAAKRSKFFAGQDAAVAGSGPAGHSKGSPSNKATTTKSVPPSPKTAAAKTSPPAPDAGKAAAAPGGKAAAAAAAGKAAAAPAEKTVATATAAAPAPAVNATKKKDLKKRRKTVLDSDVEIDDDDDDSDVIISDASEDDDDFLVEDEDDDDFVGKRKGSGKEAAKGLSSRKRGREVEEKTKEVKVEAEAKPAGRKLPMSMAKAAPLPDVAAIDTMSVHDLKNTLQEMGIDHRACVEKVELVTLLKETVSSRHRSGTHPSSTATPAAEPRSAAKATPKAATAVKPEYPAPSQTASKPRKSPTSTAAAKAASAAAPLSGVALKAIAAVDSAIKKLPDETGLKFSFIAEGTLGHGADAEDPPNHGAKDVPTGQPDCLTGKTFVISGVLDSLRRGEAEDLIKRHGGRVTGSVSGKTTFLLVGDSCGRSKYAVAKDKGTCLIDEDGLISLIQATVDLVPKTTAPPPTARDISPAGPMQGASPRKQSAAGITRPPPTSSKGNAGHQLWVDKYKPTNSQELVGNNGLVATLRTWLSNWEAVQLRGAEPKAPSGSSSKPKDLAKKAVLLSGTPGIGKTSAAHIISRECGFEVVEMNASDTRNKSDSKIQAGMGGRSANIIKEMATNRTLLVGADGKMKKQLLIMDEVDGMSGGDRGGVQDLIQTIKSSKVPIICICNDKWNQKLKSLRNYCVELDFRAPTPQAIRNRMMVICKLEGLNVNDSTMEALAKGANADLRSVLGQLQMVRLSRSTLSYDDVKGSQSTSKDSDLSPFECSRKLLEPASSSLSMIDRRNMAMADDIVPLLIQENYLNHRPTIASTDEQRLRAVAKAADAISAADLINTSIRRSQNWALMPAFSTLACLVPGAYMRGGREAFWPGDNFPRFTSWMGNFSTSKKQQRLLGELTTTMVASGHMTSHRSPVRLEYLPALRHLLSRPLVVDGDGAGVQTSVDLMKEYCVSREMFDYVLDVTKFKTKAEWGEDPMKDVPTKVKSLFTRTFNQQGLEVKCGMMLQAPLKGKRGKRGEGGEDEDEDEGQEDAELGSSGGKAVGEAEEEEDGDEGDVLVAAAKAQQLAAKLSKKGVSLQLKSDGKAGKKAPAKVAGGRVSGGRGGKGSGGRGSGKGKV